MVRNINESSLEGCLLIEAGCEKRILDHSIFKDGLDPLRVELYCILRGIEKGGAKVID